MVVEIKGWKSKTLKKVYTEKLKKYILTALRCADITDSTRIRYQYYSNLLLHFIRPSTNAMKYLLPTHL